MCGIAGYANISLSQEEGEALLAQMCNRILHRGPDSAGYYVHPQGIGLGMRRLRIVDLEGGEQPMHSFDGRYHIIFNGEIFNHNELRVKLSNEGFSFRTYSDTEVLLYILIAYGMDGIAQLNGMFAFALYDHVEQHLWIGRDRMGVKPLYYYWDDKNLIFASEIKALLPAIPKGPHLNRQAIWDYLTYRYVPGPSTMWENIYKLPPAHYLHFDLNTKILDLQRYWDIPYTAQPIHLENDQEYDEAFKALFQDAVCKRMLADVPVGVLLSGGLDSSAVAAVARHNYPQQLKTFSVGFTEDPATNELPYARKVATHLGTDHYEVELTQKNFLEFLPSFVYYNDEPLGDLASIPLYYVCKKARDSVTVVLSGEGSDEILGGYDFNLRARAWSKHHYLHSLTKLLPNWTISHLIGLFNRELATDLSYARYPLDQRLVWPPATMTNYMTSEEKRALMPDIGVHPDSLLPLKYTLEQLDHDVPLHQLLYLYCHSWLVDDLLLKADKMSMATSVELRTPFLDYRLVEWAARIPSTMKVGFDDHQHYATKRILRRMAQHYLPAEIINRPKQGFAVPCYGWLHSSLKGWVKEILLDSSTRIGEYCEKTHLQHLIEKGTSSQAALLDQHRLWNLLILEHWFQAWQA